MAETLRPYQSIGEMLRQPQFPEGVGLKESQRTMLVLSQALDRMANFELQKDQQRAKVEGAEFGVENAPTLADIRQRMRAIKMLLRLLMKTQYLDLRLKMRLFR